MAAVPVPGLTILAHPDPQRIGERLPLPVLALGRSVSLSRLEPAFRRRGQGDAKAALPLAVRTLSRKPLRLVGETSGAVTVDVQDTSTGVVVDGTPVQGRRTFGPEEIQRGVGLVLGRRVALLLHPMLTPPGADTPKCGLVGDSDSMMGLRHEILRLAPLKVPVLLRGESGTGKELAARALHDQSPRSNQPFVVVNMATLNPTLAAAELFGAVRGAFTGADRKRPGLFQAARHGTLFLDEIGETPVEVQAMLLRALESEEILPVGGIEPEGIEVRVIAATDLRLEEAMEGGRFRAPLYHRLAGYTLHLPPLRERLDDLGQLLQVFLEREIAAFREEAVGANGSVSVPQTPYPSAEIVARLVRHPWPGNV
ncbi:MAG: sigma-54 factor interaction domain-containing protein, partial [Acidobacteriota bacterium]